MGRNSNPSGANPEILPYEVIYSSEHQEQGKKKKTAKKQSLSHKICKDLLKRSQKQQKALAVTLEMFMNKTV